MSDAAQPGKVLPSPRILKVVGILNIVFAAALILFGVCMGLYVALLPAFGRAMNDIQKQAQEKVESRRKADLKEIEEKEEAATTDEEKQALAKERKLIEARPGVPVTTMMDFDQFGMNDPRIKAYYWVEIGTGLALNVAMIVAGVGLLRRRLWGISLGIWTAAGKLARLLLVYGYFALVVTPMMAERTGEAMGKMIIEQQKAMGRQAPAGLDVAMLVRTYTIMFTAYAAAMIVFGSIYPAISLWLLTRPGARAACEENVPPGLELNETW